MNEEYWWRISKCRIFKIIYSKLIMIALICLNKYILKITWEIHFILQLFYISQLDQITILWGKVQLHIMNHLFCASLPYQTISTTLIHFIWLTVFSPAFRLAVFKNQVCLLKTWITVLLFKVPLFLFSFFNLFFSLLTWC